MSIDDTKHFTYKEKHFNAFVEKFDGINYCFIEGMYLTPQNKFEKRIKDIVGSLYYVGINPY